MKKLIALLLALAMVFTMAACAKTPVEPETNEPEIEAPVDETPAEEEAPVEDETPAEEEAPAEDETPAEEETPAEPEMPEISEEEQDLTDKINALTADVNSEMATMVMPLGEQDYNYNLFIDYIEGSMAVTSASPIGSIAHSVVLLHLPEDADAEAVAEEIRTNMDPRKWICVEAEAADVLVSGQYVLLVMSNQADFDSIVANFGTVFGA